MKAANFATEIKKITDMKTLVIVLSLLLTVSFSTYANKDGNGEKEIVLQDSDDDDMVENPIRFSDEEPAYMSLLPFQSPYAYLYYNKVFVSFEGLNGISVIRVVDNATGVVVYEENCAGATEVVIRLDEPGDYTLQVVADGTMWEGWFVY